jgi:hypothetical protein
VLVVGKRERLTRRYVGPGSAGYRRDCDDNVLGTTEGIGRKDYAPKGAVNARNAVNIVNVVNVVNIVNIVNVVNVVNSQKT